MARVRSPAERAYPVVAVELARGVLRQFRPFRPFHVFPVGQYRDLLQSRPHTAVNGRRKWSRVYRQASTGLKTKHPDFAKNPANGVKDQGDDAICAKQHSLGKITMKGTWEKNMDRKGEPKNKRDRDRKESHTLNSITTAYDESKTSHPT